MDTSEIIFFLEQAGQTDNDETLALDIDFEELAIFKTQAI